MGKRIFWIFLLIVSLTTAAAVIYVQSESFARILKDRIQQNVSRSMGLDLGFDRLKIGVLPPSVSLTNVDLKVVDKGNRIGLSPDTVFKAKSVGFTFRMIQAFSRGIAVNKVFISDAEVSLEVPSSKSEGPGEKLSDLVHKPIEIQISENFSASIRQFELRNSQIDISWKDKGQASRLKIRSVGYAAVTPSKDGTNLVLNAEDIDLQTPKIKESVKVFKANADVQKSLILLSNLDVQRREAALHASGRLVGSIDNLPESRPDIDIILRGPFSEFADFEKTLGSFGGEILADAKIVGRLRDPSLQGKLEVRGFTHSMWAVDKMELHASYGAGLLIVDSFHLTQGGGNVFLKNKMEVPIPFKPAPTAFQLRLENAKFEDFAGDLKKSVNNLKMQLDGAINVRIDFADTQGKVKLAALNLRPDVKVSDLELNNQVYGKTRPYNRIFKIAPFQLGGNVQIKNGDVTVTGGKLALNSGSLEVNGTITQKEGYNLRGVSEKVNIGAEAGNISGIPIEGEGALAIHVHGKSDDVKLDFDINQQKAKFVNFDFGQLAGKVTYDDRRSLILIPGVNGKHGGASYEVSGKVDLGSSDDISLDVSFADSPPEDIFAIFAHQLKKITWIPHGMTGALRGVVKVGGKYTDGLNTLDINAKVSGRSLTYKGEMVHEVHADAGVSKGAVYARNVQGKKYDSPFTGNIDYDLRTDEMRYVLSAEKGKIRSLDFLASSGIPIDGRYAFHSEGKGKWEAMVSKTRFEVSSGFIRTRPLPPVVITYDTTAEASAFALKVGATGSLAGTIAHSARADSSAVFSMQQAELDYFLCVLSRANCNDPGLHLTVTANAKFHWKGWNWSQMNGSGSLQEVLISKTGYNLRVNNPVAISAVNGMLESENGVLEGEDSRIGFHFKGKVDGSAINNSIKGSASLKVLEFVTPLILEARGRMRLDIALTGDLANGSFRGGISMEEGMLRVSGLDAPVDNLVARFKLQDSRVSIEEFTGQLGGGSVQASGGLDLYLNRPPRFAIDLFLANNRLKFFPVNFAEISDAKLSFNGVAPPYLFSGTARAKRVMMRNNFDLSKQKALQNARYLPEKVAGVKSFYEVRIRGLADGGIFVENDLLNAEFRGEVTLMNNFEFPQIVGRAELVRGKLLFRNTAFTLEHAFIRVPNPEIFNPQFQIGGVSTMDNYRINIFASGTIDRPKITLSSNPSLPQEDIVSLLAFGYRGEDTRKVNPNDTTAITYSEVGSILLEQLQLSQNLQSKGLRVTVAPTLNDGEANIIRPNSAATASPKVYVQTQVLKNLEAAFGGTVASTQGQNLDAKLEYRLGRKASVSAVYEQSTSVDASETSRSSYGADLKFRWGFK